MSPRGPIGRVVDALRRADTHWQRYWRPDARHVVLDAKTAMEYAVMAPVHRALARDPRVRLSVMSSERPGQLEAIYRDAPQPLPVLTPRRR